jgi:hypothetical protein
MSTKIFTKNEAVGHYNIMALVVLWKVMMNVEVFYVHPATRLISFIGEVRGSSRNITTHRLFRTALIYQHRPFTLFRKLI